MQLNFIDIMHDIMVPQNSVGLKLILSKWGKEKVPK